jgi:hypothetical protein
MPETANKTIAQQCRQQLKNIVEQKPQQKTGDTENPKE